MKVYRITQDAGAPLILDNLRVWDDVIGSIEYGEVGEIFTITVIEMSEREYKNLPEWGGF